jgi:transcriptional regulator with XRE-family HTH domain
MTFRDELKRLREKAGLTQEGLAQKIGTSVGNIRNYEQGISLPSFPGVVKLAKALSVDCTAFAECEDVNGDGTDDEKPTAKSPATRKGKK